MIKNQNHFLKKYSQKRMIIFFMGAIFFLFGLAWMFLIEPNLLLKTNLEITLTSNLKQTREFKIVHISDVHFRNFGARERKLISVLKKISPDYIFITGDLLDWRTKDFLPLEIFLKELSFIAPGNIYGVYGNHEYRNRKFFQIKTILKKWQIKFLENENTFLKEGLYLIGIGDPHSKRDNLKKSLLGVESQFPKILLVHSPGIFEKIQEKNILILAGHTHGAQINIPVLTEIIFPLKYNKKYKRGLFFEDKKWLYVSRGVGTTFLPARLFSPPEITIINLKIIDEETEK